MKLQPKDIKTVRETLLKKQRYRCPICNGRMLTPREKEPTLDHDHSTGFIRDVICRNCNAMEGKLRNIARRSKNGMTEIDWLENMLNYWKRHQSSQHSGLIHPTHKTPAEKRELRNAKARKKRAALKGK